MADSEVRQKDASELAAEWLNRPEHDIGFEAHKSEDCGAGKAIVDSTCERCAVEIALAAYGKESYEAGMRAGEIARWIPVEEKLPEIGASVLVVTTPSRYVHDMKLVQREKSPEWRNYFDHNRPEKYYWLDLAGVTHWQPLPAAPEEKKA